MKLAGLWRICVSLLLTLSGLLVVFGLNRIETQAADNPPPYVQAPHFAHITTVTTPTLPTRFTLLAPAFELIATDFPFTLTIDAHSFSEAAQLAYRPNVTAPWQRLKLAMDTQKALWLVPNAPCGTYAVVNVTAATRPPAGAMVIDDLSANFQWYGEAANWHAVTGSKYYLEHAYWTYNTYNAIENYGIWTPTTGLSGAYAVQVFVPGNYADTERAVYQIYHDNQTAVYTLSQNSYWAEWVNLGVYTFTPATASYVQLNDMTYESVYTNWVAFDAVAFVPQIKRIYLPLIIRNYPFPAKQWSGMHMGNRIGDAGEWSDEMLAPFEPAKGGIWPKLVVVQSEQLFSFTRYTDTCRIKSISVIRPNLLNYLRRATQEGGTWVVIRITPSPGNFAESANVDWPPPGAGDNPILGRTMLTGEWELPGGWQLCDDKGNSTNTWRFRPAEDVGDEILAIQRYLLFYAPPGLGWGVYGFEPANEPNIEWYRAGISATVPALNEQEAWENMDTYFTKLYEYVHDNAGVLPVRVLTPPMAQHAYAEVRNPLNCQPYDANNFSGYSYMPQVFNSETPKNDGYSFHNYWVVGREQWHDCFFDPPGHHVTMYVPSPMHLTLRNSLAVITEADLASPQQKMGNSITDKDKDVVMVTNSLRDFLRYEIADAVAVWLLNDNTVTPEHHWHQAYTPTIGFREWFTQWWYTSETP